MKFLLTNQTIDDQVISRLPYRVNYQMVGPWKLIQESSDELKVCDKFYSFTEGYIRDFDQNPGDKQAQEKSTVESVFESWPPPENITGSFSCLIINRSNHDVVVCNDAIGIYPLYVLNDSGKFYISNSIIFTGIISGTEFDNTGVIQRCVGPEFSNIGSRTILKNCKRLLPGEYSKYNTKADLIERCFDNTLFQDIQPISRNKEIHREYWDLFKKEIEYCLYNTKNVNIALSGGLDSRIVLGALPASKKINCITYGDKENYETIIAARLASKKGASFKSYSQNNLHFPPSPVLEKYVLENESVNLGSWLEVLENIEVTKREPLLMGDMTEVLNARNIKKYSSKKFRQTNFIDFYLLKKKYDFERSKPESFESWKDEVTAHHQKWYTKERLSHFDFEIKVEKISDDLNNDLDDIFKRIKEHNLPYQELYDELFAWFTHSRIPMGKQIMICNSKFKSYSPPMSLGVMRMASKIHPGLRLGSRLMDKLYSDIRELKKLQIPTSQAPLIPQNYPNMIKYPMWGIRSKIDNYLISKMVKKRDVSRRYRLFKSMNWAQIYQNPAMEENLRSYFKDNHLGRVLFQSVLNQAVARKELKQWPFANMDLLNVSSLNLEMDVILKNQGR